VDELKDAYDVFWLTAIEIIHIKDHAIDRTQSAVGSIDVGALCSL